jgi:hypothetical protein
MTLLRLIIQFIHHIFLKVLLQFAMISNLSNRNYTSWQLNDHKEAINYKYKSYGFRDN